MSLFVGMRASAVLVILLIGHTRCVELLGDTYDVIRTVDGRAETSSRILVRCTGGTIGVDQKSVGIFGTDNQTRDARIVCIAPNISYTRHLVGWVPSNTRTTVAETCSTFDAVPRQAASQTRRRMGGGGRSLTSTITESGVEIALVDGAGQAHALRGERRIFGAVALGLQLYGMAGEDDNEERINELDGKITKLGTALSNLTDHFDEMFRRRTERDIGVDKQFDTIAADTLLLRAADRDHERRLEFNRNATIALAGTVKMLNEDTNTKMNILRSTALDMSQTQQRLATDLLAVSGQLGSLYQDVYGLSVNTTNALNVIQETVQRESTNSKEQVIAIARRLSALAVAVRDGRSERQFRNRASFIFGELFNYSSNEGFYPYSDVPYVPAGDADGAILLDTIRMISRGAAHTWFAGGQATNLRVVSLSTLRIYGTHRFISENARAGMGWDDMFNLIGDSCSSACLVGKFTDACRSSCGFWIEHSRYRCILDQAHAPEFGNSSAHDRWHNNTDKLTVCDVLSQQAPEDETEFPVVVTSMDQYLQEIRLPLCVGGGENINDDATMSSDELDQIFLVHTADASVCEIGVTKTASQVMGYDFVFIYIIEQLVSVRTLSLHATDQVVYGKLPSGVTTVRSDLATTTGAGTSENPGGLIGRCMWSSIVTVHDSPLVPVFEYRRSAVQGEIQVEVTTNGVRDRETIRQSITSGFSGVSLGQPDLYPTSFLAFGYQNRMLSEALDQDRFIFNVPPSEHGTGSSRSRAGTALYMISTADTGQSVGDWQTTNNDIFDHNLAGVSVNRDKTMVEYDRADNVYRCTAGGGQASTRGVADMCKRVENGGWTERGQANDATAPTTVTFFPVDASFEMTVEIPSGVLTMSVSGGCPVEVDVSPVFGGGINIVLQNKDRTDIVFDTRSDGFGAQCPSVTSQMTIPALSRKTLRVSACTDIVEFIPVYGNTTCPPLYTSGVGAESTATIGAFNGSVDAAYVRTAIATIADDVAVQATRVAIDTNSVISEIIDTMLQALFVDANVTISLDRMAELAALSERLHNNSIAAASNAEKLNNTEFVPISTKGSDEAIQKMMDDAEEAAERARERNKNLTKNAEDSEANRAKLKALTLEIERLQGKIVKDLQVTTDVLTEIFGDLTAILKKKSAGGNWLKGLGKVFTVIGNFVERNVQKAIEFFENLVNIPGELLDKTIMMVVAIGAACGGVLLVGLIGYCAVKTKCCASQRKDAKARIKKRRRGDGYEQPSGEENIEMGEKKEESSDTFEGVNERIDAIGELVKGIIARLTYIDTVVGVTSTPIPAPSAK